MILSAGLELCSQSGCTKHFCDPFEVIRHRCDGNFAPRASQSTNQEARVSEDPILDSRKWMFYGLPPEPHCFRRHALFHPVQSILIEMSCEAPPGASVQLDFKEQAPQSALEALYMV